MGIIFKNLSFLTFILVWLYLSGAIAWGATYYVDSQGGNDSFNGLSESSPIKTIAKVNTLPLTSGDSVLFRRGDVWRCTRDAYLNVTSGDQTGIITYGAYGYGEYPVFLGSYNLSNSVDWKNEGNNIWSYGEDYATNNIELLTNPSFDTNISGWHLYFNDSSGAVGSMIRDSSVYDSLPASLKVSIVKSGTSDTHVQLYAGGINLKASSCYALRFRIKATKQFTIPGGVGLFKDDPPFSDYYSAKSPIDLTITTQWKTFTVIYKSNVSAQDARINFYLGQVVPDNTTIYIDSVSFQELANNNLLTEDVGNLIFDNETGIGFKKGGNTSLSNQGDFYYDPVNFKLFLYSAYNPGLFYSNIEAAVQHDIIDQPNNHHVLYTNLSFKYGGAHGFAGESTNDITIRECDISYIGGSYQFDTVRYGNAIEFWENAHDNLVERCRIWEIYDAALSSQGTSENNVYNLFFRNNVIWNSEYSFEFWNRPDTSSSHDVYFENNTCVNAGGGWAHSQRQDPNGRHLMFMNSQANLYRIFVRNNIFYDASHSLVRWNEVNDTPGFMLDYNLYYNSLHSPSIEDRGDLAMVQSERYDYPAGFSSYKQFTNQDPNSILEDPLFVDPLNHDYHLSAGSPAIQAGEGGVTIGAYEFQASGNQPPQAYEKILSVNEDSSLIITLTASDPENDPLTYVILTSPAHGSLSGSAPNLIYTPNAHYNGLDSFSFKANDGISDSNSANINITVNPVNYPPNTPSGLTATAVSQSQINLTWQVSSDPDPEDTVKYNIYRNSSSLPINLSPITGTNYSDTGLQPAEYTYQIEAIDNKGGVSAKSTAVSATTAQAEILSTVPNSPSNLTANSPARRQISITWQDNSSDESGFKIMRSRDGYSFSQIATVSANVNKFTNTGLSSRKKYYYKVMAYNSAGNSTYSNTASATAR